jgi:hypothetical protein
MEKNKNTVKVGTKIVFNNTGGRLYETRFTPGVEYIIKKLTKNFLAEGDCDATLNNNAAVRLSAVHADTEIGNYVSYFDIVSKSNHYPIW